MERKLGRGINNMMEFARGGEIRHTMEQSAIFDGPDTAYSTGFIRGFNRTVARTFIGLSEVVTAPIPPYDPYFFPDTWFWDSSNRLKAEPFTETPTYPSNYRPGIFADSTFSTDRAVGFSGGEIAPMIMGSRFRVFDF